MKHKHRATSDTHQGRRGGEKRKRGAIPAVIEFARKRAAPTEASGAESWSPEWAEAGEEDPDASTAGGADASRRGGEAGEGAAVGMSVGLARLGEATVGEAMPVDAGETGVGSGAVARRGASPGGGRAVCEGGGKIEREG